MKLELKSTRKKLEENKKIINTLTPVRQMKSLPPFPKAIVRMQLYHKPRSPWLIDEKTTAIAMYYKSPSMYRFLRKKNVNLPSTSIIKKWLEDFKSTPGYNKKLFVRLKKKVTTMTKTEKFCCFILDEMSIKEALEFSRHEGYIEGFEDLGEFGRRPVSAKQVLVIFVRGVYSDWKIPIAYYFSSTGVKADILVKIVNKNLLHLIDCGLIPMNIVCDQSTTNQRLYKLLNVTVKNPYFYVKGTKICAIFDVPHLLKSIRNNLLFALYLYLKGCVYISFDVIREIFAIDKQSTAGRALLKLTEKHMFPNSFQKMSVRLAAQVFSHSVASAIRTAVASGQLDNEYATATADFIEVVDNLFDALNSKHLYTRKPCNAALSDQNQHVLCAIDKGLELFTELIKVTKDCKMSRPPCFNGWLLSIKGIKMIHEIGKKEGFTYLLTGRLNQDPVENFFSIMRQKGGYNKNPTVRSFSGAFKSNFVINLMKPPQSSNCEPDEDQALFSSDSFFFKGILPVREEVTARDDEVDDEVDAQSILSSSLSDGDNGDATTLEHCSNIYFAGYLVKKTLERFSCDNCKKSMEGSIDLTDKSQLLLLHRNYDFDEKFLLRAPSIEMAKATKIATQLTVKICKKYLAQKNLFNFTKQFVIRKITSKLPHWLVTCESHKVYMLNLLIRTVIHKRCKSISADFKVTQQNKPLPKISILQHQ